MAGISERAGAALELYRATGEAAFAEKAKSLAAELVSHLARTGEHAGWYMEKDGKRAFRDWSYCWRISGSRVPLEMWREFREDVWKDAALCVADRIVREYRKNGMRPGTRGSPTVSAANSLYLSECAALFGRDDFRVWAQRAFDWILGVNPYNASYVEGVGQNQWQRPVFGQFFPSTPQLPGAVLHVDHGEYDMPAVTMTLWAAAALKSGTCGGAAPEQARRRRLVLADESRPRLHYWDSADPSACFSIPGERPMWDLKRVGDMKYRAVCKKGFLVFDLRARKVVDEFRHPLLDEVTAVCDMPDGGFVASVNPRTGPDKNKVVLLVRFSADRKPVATYRCEGFFYARSLEWDRDGKTLLLSWEKGFARLRLPDAGNVCQVVGDFRQPKGRNLFDVVPLRSGDGYLAGCGYGGGLVHFGADGKAVSTWFIPEQDGCRSLFYAQPKERPDGHVYMAHWTGHGANDSKHGWQVVEFDGEGRAVWHLHDPERFGSVSGLDVLE